MSVVSRIASPERLRRAVLARGKWPLGSQSMLAAYAHHMKLFGYLEPNMSFLFRMPAKKELNLPLKELCRKVRRTVRANVGFWSRSFSNIENALAEDWNDPRAKPVIVIIKPRKPINTMSKVPDLYREGGFALFEERPLKEEQVVGRIELTADEWKNIKKKIRRRGRRFVDAILTAVFYPKVLHFLYRYHNIK